LKASRHRYTLRLEPELFGRVERVAGVRGANRLIGEAIEREVELRERRAARALQHRLARQHVLALAEELDER
jgi:hypothetical protein